MSQINKNNRHEIEDPFNSNINQERLKKAIKDVEKGKITIHNLIEEKP